MSESRREVLLARSAAHDARAESFGQLSRLLRVIAWDSPLAPGAFDEACAATADFAARVYGIFPPGGEGEVPEPEEPAP